MISAPNKRSAELVAVIIFPFSPIDCSRSLVGLQLNAFEFAALKINPILARMDRHAKGSTNRRLNRNPRDGPIAAKVTTPTQGASSSAVLPLVNLEHRHGALGLMTPHDMHYGLAAAKWQHRAEVLRAAYAAHPERFPRGVPVPPPLPTAA
jgi:hypothetical protein